MRQIPAIASIVALSACLFPAQAYSQGTPAAKPSARAATSVQRNLARAYSLKNRKLTAEAAAAFEAVLKDDPENHAAITELGYLNAGLKNYDAAVKYLSSAAAQEPGNMRVHMDLAYFYLALQQKTQAYDQFKIVASSAGSFQAAALRQVAFNDLAARDYPSAASEMQSALVLEPGDYALALQLGYTYTLLKKEEQARKAFSAALASGDAKIHDAAEAALESTGGESVTDKPAPAKSAPAKGPSGKGMPDTRTLGASL